MLSLVLVPLTLLCPPVQVKVCVIDSGIRTTHEDLAPNIAGGWNRCVNALD